MRLNFVALLFYSLSSTHFLAICLLTGMEKFEKVRVSEKNFALVKNLHGNWYSAGLKAIIGKLGGELYQKLGPEEQKQLGRCLDNIEDKRDLVLSSQCLVKFRTKHLVEINRAKLKLEEKKVKQIGAFAIEQSVEEENKGDEAKSAATFSNESANKKKLNSTADNPFEHLKREKQQQEEKNVISEQLDEQNARKLAKFTKFENARRRRMEEWGETVDDDNHRKRRKIKQAVSQDKLLSRGDRSTLFKITNLIDKFFGKNENFAEKSGGADPSPSWTQLYDTLVKIKLMNDRRRKMPGARVYEMRMYDLVLSRDEPSLGPKEMKSGSGILKMGIQLLNKLRNSTRANAKFKLLSPRFMPLLPEEEGTEETNGATTAAGDNEQQQKQQQAKLSLSPTILALYDLEDTDGKGGPAKKVSAESASASLVQLLKTLGITSQDREALLHTLLDVSGSVGHVQKAMELLKELNFFEIENDLLEANTRIGDAFTKMEQSFDQVQQQEMHRDGWTFLRQSQFDQLCRDQYAQLPDQFRQHFQQFSQMSREAREAMLWKRIERIARNIPDEIADKLDRRRWEKRAGLSSSVGPQRRRKRQQSPPAPSSAGGGISVLSPIVLQPFMFSPSLTPSVLGPLVLSPNIFSPIILAPSVLSPFILSPSAPMPLILSPYVLSPYILSPMALTPFILTPYVLSPNILNPYALSPLILSPTVLSPDILSPQILGGAILSPGVGSPAILTETFLMASVLSPSVLS